MRKSLLLLLLVALLGVTAACGGDDDTTAEPAATGGTDTGAVAETDPCAKDQLQTVVDGSLSIGADNPSFPPWFQNAKGAPWDPTGPPTDPAGFTTGIHVTALATAALFAVAAIATVVLIPATQRR